MGWGAQRAVQRVAQTVTQFAVTTTVAVGRMRTVRGVVERAGQRAEAAEAATRGPH